MADARTGLIKGPHSGMIIVNQNHEALQRKAATLVEALPYMHKYAGETFVIKYGGHAMGDASLARQFATDVALLKQVRST